MKAYKCEGCEKFFEGDAERYLPTQEEKGIFVSLVIRVEAISDYDVCPKCMKERGEALLEIYYKRTTSKVDIRIQVEDKATPALDALISSEVKWQKPEEVVDLSSAASSSPTLDAIVTPKGDAPKVDGKTISVKRAALLLGMTASGVTSAIHRGALKANQHGSGHATEIRMADLESYARGSGRKLRGT